MSNSDLAAAEELSRLSKATRLSRLSEIGRAHGFFRRLSSTHSALYVEEGDTLLVTFDAAERVIGRTKDGLPLGFRAVERDQVSLLNILGARQTWFRDEKLFAFFDELIDAGFFDQFDRILFLGLGPMCGYGALTYSVAAPFARVLAISPAATLDRGAAPFERRFRNAWSMDFTDRYGYAPAMAEAAEAITLVYDPADVMSASHAALFDGANTTRHKLRHGGMAIGAMLAAGGTLWDLVRRAADGPVTTLDFARASRPARRLFAPYLGKLIANADQTGHPRLALAAAEYGQRLVKDGRFDDAVQLFRGRLGGSAEPQRRMGG
ncbi:MAG: phosphoadenosine phosphosulfate reductase [Pseudomonadota bacterium]